MLFIKGWSMGEHGEWSKYSNYERSVRVPLIVHVPCVTRPCLQNHHQEHSKASSLDQKGFRKKQYVDNFVELVDVFPSIVDLAGLQPVPQCAALSRNILCTEGLSFAPLIINDKPLKQSNAFIASPPNIYIEKLAAFSQYPRPTDEPQLNSDQPKLADIKIMGYSIRTANYRYTEWVRFNHTCFCADWNDIHANELYMHQLDPLEDHNVANNVRYLAIQKEASFRLHAGWRQALNSN